MIRKMGEHPEQYVRQPGRDFTRPRTLTFETVISLLLTMSENSIGKILIGRFQNSGKTPSASAFVQQRQKLLPAALETLFHRFTALLRPEKTFCGCRLLAVDGSSLKSAAYPEDPASYRPGTPRQHGWNLWHMNALFISTKYPSALSVYKPAAAIRKPLSPISTRTGFPSPLSGSSTPGAGALKPPSAA
nr:hypothetical protein [uncultured Oscillibacter sp.]